MDSIISINKRFHIENYIDDVILEYLQDQNDLGENQLPYLGNYIEQQDTDSIVEDILNDVLTRVDKSILLKPVYKLAQQDHNQYALFDLVDIIPGFNLDDTIIAKLCFRETVLISNLDISPSDRNGNKPNSVGGLCLKIEMTPGLPMPQVNLTEKDINKSVAARIAEIKRELAIEETPLEDSVKSTIESDQEKLQKYEAFLQEQRKTVTPKFIVHVSSEFDVEGQNAGSKITTWVDQKLHTLEERRTEYICRNNSNMDERILYYALQENKYYLKRSANKNESRNYYPLSLMKDLVGEGANFLLMRYLAITKYEGTFELSTILLNGDMCRNIYDCKGPKLAEINNVPVEVCKIYRTILEKCGISQTSVTVMTIHGLIVSHEWDGYPYILQINPLLMTKGKPKRYEHVPSEGDEWMKNFELMSMYLDCKEQNELKMETYMQDHPEITDMMADYLQSILLLKPENIMQFTYDYFSTFYPFKLPSLSYFDNNSQNQDNDLFW